jgi:hypothetical protein
MKSFFKSIVIAFVTLGFLFAGLIIVLAIIDHRQEVTVETVASADGGLIATKNQIAGMDDLRANFFINVKNKNQIFSWSQRIATVYYSESKCDVKLNLAWESDDVLRIEHSDGLTVSLKESQIRLGGRTAKIDVVTLPDPGSPPCGSVESKLKNWEANVE